MAKCEVIFARTLSEYHHNTATSIDGTVKSGLFRFFVIPAKAGHFSEALRSSSKFNDF